MPVESPDDLAGFFDPSEFADEVPMVATIGGLPVPFDGIFTEGFLAEDPGTTVDITVTVPRVITAKANLPDIAQGDLIARANGTNYTVNDLHFKNNLVILHLHEAW